MWIFNTSNRAHAVTTPRSDIGTFQAAVILSEVEGSAIAFSLYQFALCQGMTDLVVPENAPL
jgi:hypothetical protein